MVNRAGKTVFLDQLPRWQRHGITLIAGAIASLALPPANIWPAVFIAFSVLVLVLDPIARNPVSRTQKFKSAFVSGWLFGFGYFVVSLYWIGAAFLVEADKFALLMPLAVAALPAGIALFWGLASGLAILLWRPGLFRILVFATVFTGTEWLRGQVLTGFPWNTVGYTSAGMGGIDQLASLFGLYGVTFFILVCAMAPALMFRQKKHLLVPTVLFLSFATVWVGGNIHKNQNLSQSQAKGSVIRVVQPNIDQKKKWDRAFTNQNINKYFQLSESRNGNTFDVLVWPESALPLLFQENFALKARVAELLPAKSVLIMGALRRQFSTDPNVVKPEYFNSVLAIDTDGETIATYDKFHLVPFGEYLPGEKWLEPLGLRKIVAIPGGFSSGSGPQTLRAGSLPPFSPLVCYEIGFPGQIVNQSDRPDWIVNVTNDGWFGKTAGPYQHLSQARFRAIEQGLPIVRAANTGISAVVDPFGNIIKSLALGTSGVFDVRLPKPLAPTVFARYGDWAALAFIIGVLIVLTGLDGLNHRRGKAGKRR